MIRIDLCLIVMVFDDAGVVDHAKEVREEFPFLRSAVPLFGERVEEGHFVASHGEVLSCLKRIDVFLRPRSRAKIIDGVRTHGFAAMRNIMDNDEVGSFIEASRKSAAGSRATFVNAAGSRSLRGLCIWSGFTKELTFLSPLKHATFRLHEADDPGGLGFVGEVEVGSISQGDGAIAVFPATGELPELEREIPFDAQDVGAA